MKATDIILICLSSAALKVSSNAGTFLSWGFPVDHHYPLHVTVVSLLDAFSFASTLEWLILVARPRCKDEQCAKDVCALLSLIKVCFRLREDLNNHRSEVHSHECVRLP